MAFSPSATQFFAQGPADTTPPVGVQASGPLVKPAARFNTALTSPDSFAYTAYTSTSASTTKASTTPEYSSNRVPFVLLPPAAPLASGENVNISIGTLPAGKAVTIVFQVTVDSPLPPGTTQISNQGTVTSNELPNVLTTNSGTSDCEVATETCTPVDRPDTTVISLTRQSANPNRNASVTWQIVFADPVDGLTPSNFGLVQGGSVSGASITGVTETSGPPSTTWNISANTGTGSGTLGLNFINDTGLSHDVTSTLPFVGQDYTIDKSAPTVASITRQSPAGNPTNANLLVFRITFNEPVTGVGANSFVASGTTTTIDSSVAAVTPNLVFDFTVDGSLNGNLNNLNGTVGLNVSPSPTITDLAGNTLLVIEPSPASNDQTYTVDNTAPTATSILRQSPSGNPTNADLLVFRITFNEAVTGVGANSFVASGTTTTIAPGVSAITPNLVFDFTVDGSLNGDLSTLNGTVGLNVSPSPTITDLAGNTLAVVEPSPASNDQTYTLDNAGPTVTINQANGQADPTGTSPINFTVTFNEDVTDFDDLTDVTLSGTAGATTAVISGGPQIYTIAVSGMAGAGTVIASVPAGAALDLLSQASAASSSTDNQVTYTTPADLSITKTDGVTTAVPGGSVTYTITASNAGPNNAPAAIVADTFPASLTATWTCVGAGGGTCTASGSGNINDTVNLPAAGSVTYTASATISASATGTLANTATVSSGIPDSNPANNSATDTDTLAPQADLAITKTDGVTTAVPGGSVTYTITASNSGPSNAPGATVADTFPAILTATWTCVGAGGGTCTASGSGNLNDTVNLPAGGSVTYTVSATINSSASGTLSNTATVTSIVTDPNPANNSATDTDTLTPQADLAITKTDGVTTATPGGSVTYTITASNSGPSNAPGATVADTFPASLTATWTLLARAAEHVPLPVRAISTIPSTCLPVDRSPIPRPRLSTGQPVAAWSNTATVTSSGGVTDPNPANNSATDTDTIAPQADLAITKTDGVTTAVPGGSVTYTITASNSGPKQCSWRHRRRYLPGQPDRHLDLCWRGRRNMYRFRFGQHQRYRQPACRWLGDLYGLRYCQRGCGWQPVEYWPP